MLAFGCAFYVGSRLAANYGPDWPGIMALLARNYVHVQYAHLNPSPGEGSPVTDAIMDRIVHNAYLLPLEGKSMRERHGLAAAQECSNLAGASPRNMQYNLSHGSPSCVFCVCKLNSTPRDFLFNCAKILYAILKSFYLALTVHEERFFAGRQKEVLIRSTDLNEDFRSSGRTRTYNPSVNSRMLCH